MSSEKLREYRELLAKVLHDYRGKNFQAEMDAMGVLSDIWYELTPDERKMADGFSEDIAYGRKTVEQFYRDTFGPSVVSMLPTAHTIIALMVSPSVTLTTRIVRFDDSRAEACYLKRIDTRPSYFVVGLNSSYENESSLGHNPSQIKMGHRQLAFVS